MACITITTYTSKLAQNSRPSICCVMHITLRMPPLFNFLGTGVSGKPKCNKCLYNNQGECKRNKSLMIVKVIYLLGPLISAGEHLQNMNCSCNNAFLPFRQIYYFLFIWSGFWFAFLLFLGTVKQVS